MKDLSIRILKVEECADPDYALSVVKYSIGSDFVSYVFSNEEHDDYDEAIISKEIGDHLVELGGIENIPLWSVLSPMLLHLISDSYWDMKFIDWDNENWNQEEANEILKEATQYKVFNNVIEPGDADSAYITIYADAMNCVNWNGHILWK